MSYEFIELARQASSLEDLYRLLGEYGPPATSFTVPAGATITQCNAQGQPVACTQRRLVLEWRGPTQIYSGPLKAGDYDPSTVSDNRVETD